MSRSARWSGRQSPPRWDSTRKRILARDENLCQMRIRGVCTIVATAVDHIDRLGPEIDENYQSVCGPCHQLKTSREAAAARAKKYNRKRPPQRHPGIIDP